jgi:AraC-like DNA-binding protein
VHFSQHSPAGRLKSVVKTMWRARGTRAEFSTPDPIVPDGCVEIIFNLGDRFIDELGELQPRTLLAGQMTRPVVALPAGNVDLIGIRFFSGRAGSALGMPMWEVQDRLIDASAVTPRLDRLADDLQNMRDDRRRLYVEEELPTLLSNRESSSAVDQALALIDGSRGKVRIDHVARRVGITRRQLERRFKDDVGLGAKHLARIVRVHAALQMMKRDPLLSGAEISAECGYSDQAHLIRECQALTGRTPARLMTSERSLAGLMREAAAIR